MSKEVNVHAENIKNLVFHSYPYNHMMINPNDPHAEDCEGCLINAEVDKLVAELKALSHVKDIVTELEHEKHGRTLLSSERKEAFEKAGVPEEGSVADLVSTLVEERDRLLYMVETTKNSIDDIAKKLR